MEQEIQFFSRNRPSDWEAGAASNLEWAEGGLRICQTQKYGIARTVRLTELEGVGEVAAFAIGRYGRIYLLDDAGNLWLYDQENRYHELLFPPGHQLFGSYAMMAVGDEAVYIADPDSVTPVAAYSLSNGQTYWSRDEAEEGQPLHPLALSADAEALYVVTAVDVEDGADGETIVPAGGRFGILRIGLRGGRSQLFLDEKWINKEPAKLRHMRHRFFTAVRTGGAVYAFDGHTHILYAFASDGELQSRIYLPALQFAGLAVDAAGQLYIGDSRIIEEEGEDDRFVLNLGTTGEQIAKVAGFRGKADQLQIDAKDRMYILNGEQRTITMLEMQPRTMERLETGSMEGVHLTRAFDSTEAETVWHKVSLLARIPEETQLKISYFSSDRDSLMVDGAYMHIDSYLLDPDIAVTDKARALAPYWSAPIINPKDALLADAKGRYLWLKIEWIGSERKTPLLQRLRVHYPRASLLTYLPALYQEDPQSRQFLERFLSLFGTLFMSVEDRIAELPRIFDSDLAEGDLLRWLGTWVGIEVDEHWTESQIRRFLRDAPELYRYRGTRRGIAKMVEIYTGEPPFIVEFFEYRQMREMSELREMTDSLYGSHSCSFTVLVKPEHVPTDKHRQMLQRMLDQHKPAFTEARLILLEPWMYLDMHTYMGVNTQLTEPSLLTLDPRNSIPNSTLLIDVDRDRRMDTHTRLELDSEME
ncbi:phage tail protein [Paenibacillus sp. IB182496]|uniref:Phage tail protein n=1 Tax=Paenibacillus sabuli TaxID=2772509 RepID=A0A927BW11_9BACL|nr:phage tail protein [Paenibacillus sabuli]MBD2847887.1 phage tail protein [Paenibacillus sabuli]